MRTRRANSNRAAATVAVPWRHAVVALLCLILAAATAGAASSSRASTTAPPGHVWALVLPSSVTSVTQAQVNWLANRGVTAIVASKLPAKALRRLIVSARKAHVSVIAPRPGAPKTACKSTAGTLRTCAAPAGSPLAAVRLARRSLVDYVIVRVGTAQQLRMLRGSRAVRTRIVAVLPLGKAKAWRAGIGYASADPALDLGVSSAPVRSGRLGGYLSLLPRVRTQQQADTEPPTVPQGMTFSARSQTTVSLAWRAASDNVGVTGYRLYRNGASVGTVTTLAYTHSGLTCGTTYTFALAAYDAAGNISDRAQATGSTATAPCSGPGSGPGPGPLPPPLPGPPPVAPSGSAHVWVDPSGGLCLRVAVAGAYVDAQACGSLQAAYSAAQQNDTINIADGTYGSQAIPAGSKGVTFRAAGGRPKFGQIVSAAANIVVTGIQIENRGGFNGPCSDPDNAVLYPCGTNQLYDDVIVDGLNAGGNNHGIRGVGRGFVLRNSEVRNIVDNKGYESGADDAVIENNYWHDIRVTNSSVHNECMYVNGGDRSVYRGNIFRGCPTMALFFTNWSGGAAYRDVLVENNVFGHTLDDSGNWHGSCAFKVGWGAANQNTVHGWIVRYNTFETAPCIDGTPAGGDDAAGQWYGNLGGIQCAAEWVYRYNVGGTCGGASSLVVNPSTNNASNQNQAPFYVNAPAGDFHLKAGAAAIDRGDPGAYPSTDRDKKPRPGGGAPDAGAYEYGA